MCISRAKGVRCGAMKSPIVQGFAFQRNYPNRRLDQPYVPLSPKCPACKHNLSWKNVLPRASDASGPLPHSRLLFGLRLPPSWNVKRDMRPSSGSLTDTSAPLMLLRSTRCLLIHYTLPYEARGHVVPAQCMAPWAIWRLAYDTQFIVDWYTSAR